MRGGALTRAGFFFLGLRRVWFHHRGMDDLSSCLFWGVGDMAPTCHVFRFGSPGGSLCHVMPVIASLGIPTFDR